MSFSHIQFEASDDGIALITINRPDKRNALNLETLRELSRAFEQISVQPELRAVILTGAGDKAFAAGADIAELGGTGPESAEGLSRFGQRTFRVLETMRKPSVAALNGSVFGGGLELAMCCSVRFAVPDALLGQPEVRLGTVPGYGATQRLPQLVGRGRALEMLLSAKPVSAADAHRMGLVNRILPADQLMAESRAWLAAVLNNGSYALGLTMECVDVGITSGFDAGLRFESAAFGLLASTEERSEGIRAFFEKRDPIFKRN